MFSPLIPARQRRGRSGFRLWKGIRAGRWNALSLPLAEKLGQLVSLDYSPTLHFLAFGHGHERVPATQVGEAQDEFQGQHDLFVDGPDADAP